MGLTKVGKVAVKLKILGYRKEGSFIDSWLNPYNPLTYILLVLSFVPLIFFCIITDNTIQYFLKEWLSELKKGFKRGYK